MGGRATGLCVSVLAFPLIFGGWPQRIMGAGDLEELTCVMEDVRPRRGSVCVRGPAVGLVGDHAGHARVAAQSRSHKAGCTQQLDI